MFIQIHVPFAFVYVIFVYIHYKYNAHFFSLGARLDTSCVFRRSMLLGRDGKVPTESMRVRSTFADFLDAAHLQDPGPMSERFQR